MKIFCFNVKILYLIAFLSSFLTSHHFSYKHIFKYACNKSLHNMGESSIQDKEYEALLEYDSAEDFSDTDR